MSNSIVQYYRSQNPNDPRHDDEITLDYVSQYGLDKLSQYPDFVEDYNRIDKDRRKLSAPPLTKEFSRALSSGVDQAQAKLYDTAALAGEVTGIDALTKFGEEGYKRNLEEAAQNAPTIQGVGEVESPSDAVLYLTGLVGSQAPQMLGTIGATALGGLVGGVPGGLLAGGGFGFTQMQNRGELRSTPGVDQSSVIPTAIGVGAVGAALEELPIARFFSVFKKPASGLATHLIPLKAVSPVLSKLPDGEVGKYLGRVLRHVPEQAVLEGGTEVLQEIATMAGEEYANRDNPDFELTSDQIKSRLLNSGLAGAILGGAAGTVEAIPNHEPNSGSEIREEILSKIPAESPSETSVQQPAPVNGAVALSPEAATVSEAPGPDAVDPLLTRAREASLAIGDEEGFIPTTPTPENSSVVAPSVNPVSDEDAALLQEVIDRQRTIIPIREAARQIAEQQFDEVPGGRINVPNGITPPVAEVPDISPTISAVEQASAIKQSPEPEEFKTVQDLMDYRDTRLREERQLFQREIGITAEQSERLQRILMREGNTDALEKQLTPEQRRKFEYFFEESGFNQRNGPFKSWEYDKRFDPHDAMEETDKQSLATSLINALDQPFSDFQNDRFAFSVAALHRLKEIGGTQKDLEKAALGWARRNSGSSGDLNFMVERAAEKLAQFATSQGVSFTSQESKPSTIAAVEQAASQTETNPSEAQKVAGNYKKGKVDIQGLNISIENPAGSIRSGVDANGKPWQVSMPYHYGYIRDTVGRDKDHIDVTIGPNPDLSSVFVIDQKNIDTGKFDEHKTFIGFPDAQSAIAAYDAAFSDGKGPERRASVASVTMDEFKQWLKDGDKDKPFKMPGTGGGGAGSGEPPNQTATQTINLDLVDWDNAALSEIRTKRGMAKANPESESQEFSETPEDRPSLPAFFTVKDMEFSPELGERLVSDAQGTQSTKSMTRRYTFFEDQDTSEVIGLPTWYTNDRARGGKIYRVTNPEGGRGVRLEQLMEGGRYIPVASVRFKEEVSGTDKNNISRFSDYTEFENKFVRPAADRMRATANYIGATTARMAQQGFDSDGNPIEFMSQDAVVENPEMDFHEAIAEELLATKDLSREGVEQAVRAAASKDENYGAFLYASRILLSDPAITEGLKGLSAEQAKLALLNHLTDLVYAKVRTDTADAGQGVRTSLTRGGVAERFFSLPEPGAEDHRATSGEIKARFAAAQRGAIDSGIAGIDIVKAVGREVGSFSGKQRKITLALFDSENPTWDNLRLLLHEIGHDVVQGLDEQVQQAAFRGIDSFTDEQLGLNQSTDPRIRESNPAQLSPDTLSEERLVEHMALQGVERPVATGIASKIVRFIKELYFRMAMGMQKILGRPINPELARVYVRNRFESTVAGDRRGLLNFLIPPNPNIGRTDEEFFSKPGGFQEERLTADPKLRLHINIAAWNEQLEVERDANLALAEVPGVVAAAKEKNLSPMAWLRKEFRLPDAEALKKEADKFIDPETTLLVSPNQNQRFSDFAAEQSRDLAVRDAYILVQGQYEKIQKKIGDLRERIDQLESKRESQSEKFHKASEAPSLPLTAPLEAKRQANLKRWQENIQALKKEIDELTVQYEGANWISGIYAKKANELAGPLGIRVPFHFGHGAKYLAIEDVSTAEGPGKGMVWKTVQLDANMNPTNRSEIVSDVEKMEAWVASRGDRKDGVTNRIEDQIHEFMRHQVATDYRKSHYAMLELKAADVATQAKATGTPLGRLIAQMIARFVSQFDFTRNQFQQLATTVDRAHRDAANILGVSEPFYKLNFYDRAIDLMESRGDIAELNPGNFNEQLNAVFRVLPKKLEENQVIAGLLKGKKDQFLAALRKDIEANYKSAKFSAEHNANQFVGVRDESLGDGAVRKYITRGILTIPRTISDQFKAVYNYLKDSNWAGAKEAFETIGEVYNEQGPEAAWESISPMFTPEVMDGFFKPIASEVDRESPFLAPMLEDGVTQTKANPWYVRKALEASDGNVIEFLKKLHELHGGKQNAGEYIEQNMMILAKYFKEMRNTMERMDAAGSRSNRSIKNMIPGFMIDSREVEHWPSSWTTHVVFDSRHVSRISERIAAQVAFGHGNERLEKAYNDALKESQGLTRKLTTATAKIQKTFPGASKKEVEALLASEVGGKKELVRLRKLQRQAEFQRRSMDSLVEYFSNSHSVTKDLGFLNVLAGTFATAMVNQPSSAISQFAEIFTPFITWGVGKEAIRQSAKTLTGAVSEFGIGLANSLGFAIQRSSRKFDRAFERGLGDAEQMRTLKDIWDEQPSPFKEESGFIRGLRKVRETATASVGKGNNYIGFRPLGLFNQVSNLIHVSGTVNFVEQVESLVVRGMEWAKEHPDQFGPALTDLTAREWAEKIGLKSGTKEGFSRVFQAALDDHGLDYYTLVKQGLSAENSGKPIISDDTFDALKTMWVKESVAQGNILTMTPAAWTNSLLRFMLPLNGWAIRRTLQLPEIFRNEKGERATMAGVAKAMAGLAILAGGGLAVSALVDAYNEELVRKRRNLRRLTLDQDTSDLAYAILEHTARIGTFGMLGDVVNAAVNVGTGQGDNRGISLDGRVIFMNSALGMTRSISNLINQDFVADYANVIRPAMFSVGGNGALQYLQLLNRIAGLDNQEGRAVARTNVGNWLRVVGRENGLEVRTSHGGYSSPTPMTPYITRMQLAAYGDNRDDFMAAYRDALAEARKQGQSDPAGYVERMFASRHPLRNTFRNSLSEPEYRRVLAAMPEDGRRDVVEAVNLLNRYGAMIGATPFEGREQKFTSGKPSNPLSAPSYVDNATFLREARSRAALF